MFTNEKTKQMSERLESVMTPKEADKIMAYVKFIVILERMLQISDCQADVLDYQLDTDNSKNFRKLIESFYAQNRVELQKILQQALFLSKQEFQIILSNNKDKK